MKRIIITRSQLNEIYSTPNLKKIQRNIYKFVSDYCGKMHSDDAWQDVRTLIDMIQSVDGVTDVHVGAGEYFNYTNPEKGAYRDYQTTVVTEFGNLYGYIRCHAAGTMDDIFKYYDITISLYPDKTKDISESKINEVMDSQKTQVVFDGNNANELGINAQEKYNDAIRSGLKSNAIQMNGKTVNNNASDKDETVIGFNTNEPNIRDAVTKSVQNAVNNGADINKLNVQGNSEDVTNESKKYTKQQIERARLYEMRRNGKIMTKKELRESFGYDDEEEQTIYGIGTLIYKISTDEVEDYDGLDMDSGDDFETVSDAFATIRYMCSYPEDSVEWDIRYANNWIPLFYIYDKETGNRIDNKIYVSSIDEKYKDKFSPIGVKLIIINPDKKLQLGENYNSEDIISLINNSNSFQAMEAYRLTYGNEALKELSNGWNFVQGMVNKYYDSTPDKQQEFVARLKGERDDDPNAIDVELELN